MKFFFRFFRSFRKLPRFSEVRLFLVSAVFSLAVTCQPRDVVPDSVMVGQGIGDTDGTFLYVNFLIPQPD